MNPIEAESKSFYKLKGSPTSSARLAAVRAVEAVEAVAVEMVTTSVVLSCP